MAGTFFHTEWFSVWACFRGIWAGQGQEPARLRLGNFPGKLPGL